MAIADSTTVEYRDIPGFPGYRVGDDGSVWSCLARGGPRFRRLTNVWREKRQRVTSRGYKLVSLMPPDGNKHRNFKVHRLVLEAFVGPCPPGMECRHFPDNNRANNRLENLSWATHQENVDDRVTHGTVARGEAMTFAKLTEANVRQIREIYAKGGISTRKLGVQFGVSGAVIYDIVTGKNWKHVV